MAETYKIKIAFDLNPKRRFFFLWPLLVAVMAVCQTYADMRTQKKLRAFEKYKDFIEKRGRFMTRDEWEKKYG